jgi:hypothetical protein
MADETTINPFREIKYPVPTVIGQAIPLGDTHVFLGVLPILPFSNTPAGRQCLSTNMGSYPVIFWNI